LKTVAKFFESFFSLFFPRICLTCQSVLSGNETVLCTSCRASLPETDYHLPGKNPVEELFYGRLKLEKALALLFFDKGSKYRKLLHQLKYKGRKEAGIFLGHLLGSRIKVSNMPQIDFILPVPLHPARLRRRGYNQSRIIAEGIAEVLNVPVNDKALKRIHYTSTQTRRGRYERWQNVEGIFNCPDPLLVESKHILLVDDVITTGSTLEAAGTPLLKCKNVRISVAAAAYASN
jgi:ComF family protein